MSPDVTGVRLGVDVGATKIEIVAFDPASRTVVDRRRALTARTADAFVRQIAELTTAMELEIQRRSVMSPLGMCVPGLLDAGRGQIVCSANCGWLVGVPLRHDLEIALDRPVIMDNDAVCFAMAQSLALRHRDVHTVFAAILGTGVGGALLIDGEPVRGRHGMVGEWGHNPLPPAGQVAGRRDREAEESSPACGCGRVGCIETWLGAPALEREYARLSGQIIAACAIADAAAAGDPHAIHVLDRFVDRLARSLAGVINVIDPDAIVLGGGLSNLAVLYQAVPLAWEDYVLANRPATLLLPPAFGDSAGAIGAALLRSVDRTTGISRAS
ncbi:MAG TPA: ROK family protein [Vicinamibacterales bacterium]|nr:ROK family protein [Vicinamibacterales bacterium]